MAKKKCNKCNVSLNDNNWLPANRRCKNYLCRACGNLKRKSQQQALKKEVFEAYGGRCFCCHEDNLLFLTIDHIDGLGADHRRSLKKQLKRKNKLNSRDFYIWLKRNGFPKDNYQILCFNCNCAKHINGICPHQENKT